jgi:hypothetical protein
MTGSPVREFGFRFDPTYRVLGRLFGISERSAMVRVFDDQFLARFGWWSVRTPVSNIRSVAVTGPYQIIKTAGPAHLSLVDRGLTFATNPTRGVCLEFAEPVRGIEPFGLLRHPNLTVTVADVPGLVELLRLS